MPTQHPEPSTPAEVLALQLSPHIHTLVYVTIFLISLSLLAISGQPTLLVTHTTLNVIAYSAAISVPYKYRTVFHPVVITSIIFVLPAWFIQSITHLHSYGPSGGGMRSLKDTLHVYKTGNSYLTFFRGGTIGAGDLFACLLDVGIVGLALPMFRYRAELWRFLPVIMITNLGLSIGSLFGYPALSFAVGVEGKRSLSFAARSLTLALAQPVVRTLNGDLSLVAVLCIASGILGVLIGGRILKLLRIPEDDYITRGITLGANSSAIATAHLLTLDPRAAALSSLSMALFGTTMVVLSAVPTVNTRIQGLVSQSST